MYYISSPTLSSSPPHIDFTSLYIHVYACLCSPNATVQQSLRASPSAGCMHATASAFCRGSHTLTLPGGREGGKRGEEIEGGREERGERERGEGGTEGRRKRWEERVREI